MKVKRPIACPGVQENEARGHITTNSQKPPRQMPEQQPASLVQAPPTGVQEVGGGVHAPAVHRPLQHEPLAVQAAPSAVQGVLQACVVGSQTPRQQSALVVQAAISARQVSVPNWQRGGSARSSQTSVQQPRPDPELQVSPVGRQLRFARST